MKKSSTKKLTTRKLESLPDEILIYIFKFLKLSDLFNKKLVSKRWNFLINKIKYDELIIRIIGNGNNYWFPSYESINLNNTINYYSNLTELKEQTNNKLINRSIIEYSTFKSNFINIKKLKICLNELNLITFQLDKLNEFNKLIHLEIDSDLELDNNIDLRLNLKILKLKKISDYNLIIYSNCLEYLCCVSLKNIQLNKFNTIIQLDLEDNETLINNLNKFIKLEILKFNLDTKLDDKFLFNLPFKLKEIHFYYFSDYLDNLIIELFNRILIIKKKLNLKIYLKGIQIKNQLNDKFINKEHLLLFKDNYNNLANQIVWYDMINYNDLIKVFNQIPTNFHQIFINIQSFKAFKIDDNCLIEFLINCDKLSELNLCYPLIKQTTFNRLPIILDHLEELKLEFNLDEINNFNFNFVQHFTILRTFQTNTQINLVDVLKIINNLKLIESFSFLNNQYVSNLTSFKPLIYDFTYGRNRWYDLNLKKLTKLINEEKNLNGKTKLIPNRVSY